MEVKKNNNNNIIEIRVKKYIMEYVVCPNCNEAIEGNSVGGFKEGVIYSCPNRDCLTSFRVKRE